MTAAKNSGKGPGMKPVAATAFAAFSLLAACAQDPLPPPMHCPQVLRVRELMTDPIFLPGRSDPAAELTQAQISGVAGSCVLNKKTNTLTLTFKAGFTAEDGPANHGAPVTLPYFIAITAGDDVVTKVPGSVTLDFAGRTLAQATTSSMKLKFPNDARSDLVEILIGFQLSPGQVAYNAAHPAPGT
jgi:hypothetical protein